MYINFPQFQQRLKPILKKALMTMPSKENQEEIQDWVSSTLFTIYLRPLFEEEKAFLDQLVDILQKLSMKENLSDS